MIVTYLMVFLTTLIFVHYSIKKIIFIAHKKHLFDEPSENRKIHISKTPNLGGAAMFASVLFTSSLFIPDFGFPRFNYIIASCVILLVVGLSDDLVGVPALKKMLFQGLVSLMVTLLAGFRITDLHGLLGIHEIPYPVSIALTALFILLMINAFNLIDGINYLAASLGMLSCMTFAFCFWKMNEPGLSYLSVSMCGCLAGFLYYNRTPAKIFMGDTGALLLGFVISFLTIMFIELNRYDPATQIKPAFKSAPAIVFALLIIPIFDTLRVFTIRVLKGKSPLDADRSHIHHRLIDLRLTHLQSTIVLLLVNFACLSLVFLFIDINLNQLFLMISGLCLSLNWLLPTTLSPRPDSMGYPYAGSQVSTSLSAGSLSVFLEKKDIPEPLESLN